MYEDPELNPLNSIVKFSTAYRRDGASGMVLNGLQYCGWGYLARRLPT